MFSVEKRVEKKSTPRKRKRENRWDALDTPAMSQVGDVGKIEGGKRVGEKSGEGTRTAEM